VEERRRASGTIPQKPSVISLSLSLSVSRYPAPRDVDLVNHGSSPIPLPSYLPLHPFVSGGRMRDAFVGGKKRAGGGVGISGLSGKVSAASRRSRLSRARPPFFKIDARRVQHRRFIAEVSAGNCERCICFFGRGRAKEATRG